MTRVNKTDESLLARYIDGELPAAERAAFEARLEGETALREAVREAEAQSRTLRDAVESPLRAPANFGASVLDSVRRMPSRDDLIEATNYESAVDNTVRFGRRLLVAACVIGVFGFLFRYMAVQTEPAKGLKALNDDQLMEKLDIKAKARLDEQFREKK